MAEAFSAPPMTQTSAAATDLVAAGLAAALAMNLFQSAWSKLATPPSKAPSATAKAADEISDAIAGKRATKKGRKASASLVHYMTGAILGGIYGVAKLADYYVQAFGCHRISETRLQGDAFRSLMDVDNDANCILLGLGDEIIELLEFDEPDNPHPVNAAVSDFFFQHLAIVTSGMTAARLRQLRTGGWRPITDGTPQRLPQSAGGVTVFEFRDPEGHPLELLSFPKNNTPSRWRRMDRSRNCPGIDHSAISVRDTATSTAFYGAHGLPRANHLRNEGPEQNQLGGLTAAEVEISVLASTVSAPHVELLCFCDLARAPVLRLDSSDVATTRLVFESDQVSVPCRRIDPDGHHLIILPSQTARAT